MVELFFFLIMKTLVDLAMHVITQVDWKTGVDPGWAAHLKRVGSAPKIRRTLKQRLKIWILVGWVVFLCLVLVGGFIMQEIGGKSRKTGSRDLTVHGSITGTEIEFWDQARLDSEDRIEWGDEKDQALVRQYDTRRYRTSQNIS